jgi:hypothetical protein
VDVLKKRTIIPWSLSEHPSHYKPTAYTGVHFILSLNTVAVMVFLWCRKPAVAGRFLSAPHVTLFRRRVSKLSKFLEDAGFLFDTAVVIRDKLKSTPLYPGSCYQKQTTIFVLCSTIKNTIFFRTALLWATTQRIVVISYRRFGTNYRFLDGT